MRNKLNKVRTRFGPEAGFVPRITAAARFGAKFEALKTRMLEERLAATVAEELKGGLRHAASEAAALAWVTPYPLLVYPGLFEEKASAAALRAKRQRVIRQRSDEILALAV